MDKIEKKFKPMSCPVCDSMYFSSPHRDTYERDLQKYLSGEEQCNHCGWIYDLYQAEHPDSKDGYNEMSVNEYKKWFENKLKENPNYDYLEEHIPDPVPHKCPVCGEYEFPDILSSDICPVCGWEDIGFEEVPDEKPSTHMMSFNETVAWFKEQRKKNPKFRWIDQFDDDLDSEE